MRATVEPAFKKQIVQLVMERLRAEQSQFDLVPLAGLKPPAVRPVTAQELGLEQLLPVGVPCAAPVWELKDGPQLRIEVIEPEDPIFTRATAPSPLRWFWLAASICGGFGAWIVAAVG